MIVARLTGGLGNQMFQYAAGRSAAARLGTQLRLDSRWFAGKGSGIPGNRREFLLGCFAIDADLVDAGRIAVLPPRSRRQYWSQRLLPRPWQPTLTVLTEDDGRLPDTRFFAISDDTYLDGFWHSERYFTAHAHIVRKDFSFRTPPTAANASFAATIVETNSVSVHVRRQDYITEPKTRSVSGILQPEWYRAAVGAIAARSDAASVYVFSDDPEWCRSNLTFDHPMTIVEWNQAAAFEDMRLMSLCRHHVIANSTFSWWGAWLDPHPDKIVIAPEPWRMDRAAPQVLPDGWIRLDRNARIRRRLG
jgi:hypothetical protein